jgi:probable HAF family extracellular repeat protein
VQSLGSVGTKFTGAIAISNNGTVAGTAVSSRGDWSALRSSGGGGMDLLARDAMAVGVNDSGHIVGTSWSSDGPSATVWQDGAALSLGIPNSYGTGINDAGTVVGGGQNGTHGSAFVHSGAETTWIDVGISSSAYAVNNHGQVAGSAEMAPGMFRAFIWSSATGPLVFGTLGGRSSYANGLSDSGVVVGSSITRSGDLHAYRSDAAGMQDLGTLGGNLSAAYGVNSAGTIVGYSYTAENAMHAFVWTGGMLYDLNALVSPGSGWTLESAFGINELGQIVGSGRLNGVSSAYLLDPVAASVRMVGGAHVPEPSTWMLAGCGVAILLASRRRLVQKAVLAAVSEIDRQPDEQPDKQT